MGGLSQVSKVTFLSNVMFTRASLGERAGQSSGILFSSPNTTPFPIISLSSSPLCHIMQAEGLPAPMLLLYLFQYKIFFFNNAMLDSEKPVIPLFTTIGIVLLK